MNENIKVHSNSQEIRIKRRMRAQASFDFYGVIVQIASQSDEDIVQLSHFYKDFIITDKLKHNIDITIYLVTDNPKIPFIISLINQNCENKVFYETRNTGFSIWTQKDTPIPPFTLPPLARRFLLIHASAIDLGRGRALIYSANHYHGKTSFALEMVRRGYKFLTDDIVLFDLQTNEIQPFPRPMAIRENTIPQIHGLKDILDQAHDIPIFISNETGKFWMTHMDRIFPRSTGSSGKLVAACFLEMKSISYPDVRKMSVTQALSNLWYSTINSGLEHEILFDILCHLATDVIFFQVSFSFAESGSVSKAVDQIEERINELK